MNTPRQFTAFALAAIFLALLTSGCQKNEGAANSAKPSFYGSPPPASAAAQIEAAKEAQQKAFAKEHQ